MSDQREQPNVKAMRGTGQAPERPWSRHRPGRTGTSWTRDAGLPSTASFWGRDSLSPRKSLLDLDDFLKPLIAERSNLFAPLPSIPRPPTKPAAEGDGRWRNIAFGRMLKVVTLMRVPGFEEPAIEMVVQSHVRIGHDTRLLLSTLPCQPSPRRARRGRDYSVLDSWAARVGTARPTLPEDSSLTLALGSITRSC